jgi:lysyl-tRNA synthetase class 2
MEPHIDPFQVGFVPETGVGRRRALYLHTSPEYAMKRLLADGSGPLFQLCKAFRNGEVSELHNPEFTLLEFYRPRADYHAIMADLERLLCEAEKLLAPGLSLFSRLPFERLTVREAVKRETGIDLMAHGTAQALRQEAEAIGLRLSPSARSFDDVFFQLFLEKVEPRLGLERPTFLTEYPASMASLARLKPGDPSVCERVELYARGVELANGFSELTDEAEQRRRLVEEQAIRRAAGREAYALDEAFLSALPRMPPAAGIAVGLDRVLMLLLGAARIDDVLLFPAREFV